MYFSSIPDIKYDSKPISYPFSESDYTLAKNFFRRYKVDPNIFGYATFYNKYSIQDGFKIENIANEYYGNPLYDWVLILTNNIINPLFGLPLDNYTLQKVIDSKYGDDSNLVHHYETIETESGEVIDGVKVIALKGEMIVDNNFYSSQFTYWNGNEHKSVAGSTVSKPISNHIHEVQENEKKREIYILKKSYFNKFLNEFKTKNKYNKSSKFISSRLKVTG
tara:strand:+ start:9921 stop:10583 length:663 start_codon:yes stop_codon:yes gene_type:complete